MCRLINKLSLLPWVTEAWSTWHYSGDTRQFMPLIAPTSILQLCPIHTVPCYFGLTPPLAREMYGFLGKLGQSCVHRHFRRFVPAPTREWGSSLGASGVVRSWQGPVRLSAPHTTTLWLVDMLLMRCAPLTADRLWWCTSMLQLLWSFQMDQIYNFNGSVDSATVNSLG